MNDRNPLYLGDGFVFSLMVWHLSDLRKPLLDDTLEVIMWANRVSPTGRGDLHITNPELCD